MKTVIGSILVAAAVLWGWPAIALSDKAVIAYLDELEALSMQERPEEYCDRMHDDLTVAVTDGTSDLTGTVRIEGGKRTWCDHIASVTRGVAQLNLKTQATRNDFHVSRRWNEPWTARVSYDEQRTSRSAQMRETLRTESTDRWTLVNTVSGVKVLGLESRSTIAK